MRELDEWNACLRGERGVAQAVAAEAALVDFLVQVILDSIKVSNHTAMRVWVERAHGGLAVYISGG